MDLMAYARENILLLDGALGTVLQTGGQPPSTLNITAPERVLEVHRLYLEAGSKLILSNTFGPKAEGFTVEEIVSRGMELAKNAATGAGAFAALDVGPTGELLEPYGDLSADECFEIFCERIRYGVKNGADAVFIETMADLEEAVCAVRAARDVCALPVFCSMTFEQGMRTYMGVSIEDMALKLGGKVDFLGFNCSVGPLEMEKMVIELKKYTDGPLFVKPNAGLPQTVDGNTEYVYDARSFAEQTGKMLEYGVRAIGGCCGTTPVFIKKLSELISER